MDATKTYSSSDLSSNLIWRGWRLLWGWEQTYNWRGFEGELSWQWKTKHQWGIWGLRNLNSRSEISKWWSMDQICPTTGFSMASMLRMVSSFSRDGINFSRIWVNVKSGNFKYKDEQSSAFGGKGCSENILTFFCHRTFQTSNSRQFHHPRRQAQQYTAWDGCELPM